MFKIFKKKDSYDNESIRPWMIEQYKKLKLAQFSHNEIISVISLNEKEKEFIEKENNIANEVIKIIDKAFKETKPVKVKEVKENDKVVDAEIVKETKPVKVKEVKENDKVVDAEIVKETKPVKVKEVKENDKVVDAEIVKEPSIEKQMQDGLKKISEKYELVKESVVDPSKWTDEEVIEKALHDLTNNMEYQDKEQMSDLLRESFNSDKRLVDVYRNKYISHYKLVNNNLSNNDNKTTENKEEGGEKEIKSEVIESRKEGDKKVKDKDDDNNKINDLNIDNEMFEMLVDDVYDQYCMIFNIKKDKLKDLIIKVLQEKPEILKSTNYYFVCMRICEIIENLIMENTIEDNEEDELLNQLNSLVE
jgi:hypothetical protein